MTVFTRHASHEVSKSFTDSKNIANDAAETYRYKYRAKATLLGDVNVEPYNAVYLSGLVGDFNGYWTVLSVSHVFGGSVPYVLEVELGSDELGQDDPSGDGRRDVEGELNGSTTTRVDPDTTLLDVEFISQLSTEGSLLGEVTPTSNSSLDTLAGTETSPDFSIIASANYWTTQGSEEAVLTSAAEYAAAGYEDTSNPGVDPASLEQGDDTLLNEAVVGSPGDVGAGDLSAYPFVYVSGWIYVPEDVPNVLVSFGDAVAPTYLIEVKNSWAYFYQKIDPTTWPQQDGQNFLHIEATEATDGEFLVKDLKVTATPSTDGSGTSTGDGSSVSPGSVVSTDGSKYLVYVGTSQPNTAHEGDVWIDLSPWV
jgi:hypothetical protein